MKKLAVLAFMLLFATSLMGCKGLKEKLTGTWEFDLTSLHPTTLEMAQGNKDKAAQYLAGFKSVKFDLAKNNTFEYTAGGTVTNTGSWDTEGSELKLSFNDSATAPNATYTMNSDTSVIHMKVTTPTAFEADLKKVQ